MESRGSSQLLAPGFRFHPTDEELVFYYLRRKVSAKPLRFDAISEIDIYKVEPWDLPGMSRLKTRDLEWYFFSMLDKKYGNGSRTNRATERGYWKTTGKDRSVYHRSKVVGMKKTLVYHSGRAPKGQRSNWVMHEYRLVDEDLSKAGISQVCIANSCTFNPCSFFYLFYLKLGEKSSFLSSDPFFPLRGEKETFISLDILLVVRAKTRGKIPFISLASVLVVLILDPAVCVLFSTFILGLIYFFVFYFCAEKDAFVLCRVFQKSGAGPKNGEQYGAPFVEEEWEDDELEIVPKADLAEEAEFVDDIFLDGDDLEEILGADIPSDSALVPVNNGTGYIEARAEPVEDFQNILVENVEYPCELQYPDEQKSSDQQIHDFDCGLQYPDEQKPSDQQIHDFDCGLQYPDEQRTSDQPIHDFDPNPVKHEYMGESSNSMTSENVNCLLNEPLFEATDNFQFNDGTFLETNDLSNPMEADTSGFNILDDFLNFYDAKDDFQDMGFDPAMFIGNDEFFEEQSSFADKDVCYTSEQALLPDEKSSAVDHKNDIASSSKPEPTKLGSDYQHPFLKQASQMLGNIHAPSAFASEFPKNAALGLNAAAQASSSVHVTAGLIQIRDLTVGGKHGDYNIVLSFGFSQGGGQSPASLESVGHGKMLTGGWLYFLFLWVLMLSISFKVGTYIYAR